MSSIVDKLTQQKAITPPKFIIGQSQYETIMGSYAYGVSNDRSDTDINGFAIPSKPIVFPHLQGEIEGFGRPGIRFEQYQEHHIPDPDDQSENPRTYDVAIYNIVKYFKLLMENNPNIVDSLFTPDRCVVHITPVGRMIRDERRTFLHRGAYHKFKGYAYSQLHKAQIKTPQAGSKREQNVIEHGWDVKFGYHIVRLADEAEQILSTGDLDLERSREMLKAIRRGEWTFERTREHFERQEAHLEQLYAASKLPYEPDEARIKQLLLDCLESHYGSLADAVVAEPAAVRMIREIREILNQVA